MNKNFLKEIRDYEAYLEANGVKTHIYKIERIDNGVMELEHYFDENHDYKDDFELRCEAPEGITSNDVIYLDDKNRWCLINLLNSIVANELISTLTDNGSISYNDLSEEDKKSYNMALEAIKEAYENPIRLSYEDSLKVMEYEKAMKGE